MSKSQGTGGERKESKLPREVREEVKERDRSRERYDKLLAMH